MSIVLVHKKDKMKKGLLVLFLAIQLFVIAQSKPVYSVPQMPDPIERKADLERQWAGLQNNPPQIGVRDCFAFLLDALDTKLLKPKDIQFVLKLVQARMITNPAGGKSYGNIFWGWQETGYDIGDGNNIEFCLQYGLPIKFLFNDRLSDENRKTLDDIFALGIKGCRNQNVRISYTNIFLMKIWNFVAYGQIYNQPAITEEGRAYFNQWLYHVSHYGNREYDSPTYCGVDLESLLLINRFITDPDIKAKAKDALTFMMNDLSSHYNPLAGILAGAHSRDYNRVFSRDLLEEKYINPLIGRKNSNLHLFNELCFATLKDIGLSADQKKWMNQKNRFILQRWDSIPNAFACHYVGNKFSMASSNQAYSPDDKPFVMYLSSLKIPEMPNIAFVMEGRDDHYGVWSSTGMGDKMKHLMPPNYPANGGWGKTRHLMPFMQSSQNKGEMVMLVSGTKDHNCIKEYLNSTLILPNYLNEIWLGNQKIDKPAVGSKISLDDTQTFFARFEDVVFAFKFLYTNADKNERPTLYNDGFQYNSNREKFPMQHNAALRLTLKHPNNGKADIAIWWKAEEGVTTDKAFASFRKKVLDADVMIQTDNNSLAISVKTPSGKLGVRADLLNKKRLEYYNPVPLPNDFLFSINGTEIGKPVMLKYTQLQNK
jgi:hypothetical protein